MKFGPLHFHIDMLLSHLPSPIKKILLKQYMYTCLFYYSLLFSLLQIFHNIKLINM